MHEGLHHLLCYSVSTHTTNIDQAADLPTWCGRHWVVAELIHFSLIVQLVFNFLQFCRVSSQLEAI